MTAHYQPEAQRKVVVNEDTLKVKIDNTVSNEDAGEDEVDDDKPEVQTKVQVNKQTLTAPKDDIKTDENVKPEDAVPAEKIDETAQQQTPKVEKEKE